MVWLKNNFSKIIPLLILLIILIGELGFLPNLPEENVSNLAVNEEPIVKETPQEKLVNVEIKGQVKNPGVYQLDSQANINDALKKAGNITKDGFVENINLSQKIKEHMVIYVFSKTEYAKVKSHNSYEICYLKSFDITACLQNGYSVIVTSPNEEETTLALPEENSDESAKSSSSGSSSSTKNNQIVNINTADKNTLTSLAGIGEAKALAIIEYRKTNGKFKTIDEIKKVKGIGEAIFAKIKNYLKV